MSKDGWIKLWRKVLLNPLLQDKPFNNLSAWIDLLLQASFSEEATTIYIRSTPVYLRKGQVATSLSKLSERWGSLKWTKKRVARFLKQLDLEGMISYKTSNLATTITITKWSEHQDPYFRKGTQKGTQREHGISETHTGQGIPDAKNGEEGKEKKFDLFWESYPKKQGKSVARKVWMSLELTDDLYKEIINSLTSQKKWSKWVRNEGQFIPMPATWLRQERWEDESLESDEDKPIWPNAFF